MIHRLAVGHSDITGDDFGTIFANSVGGEHRNRPLGIADVVLDDCAWSVKTVFAKLPYRLPKVRLISGRNSPIYSLGIENPKTKPNDTGRAVLSVWNARVNEALDQHDDLRIVVMIRNMETREYRIFEEEAIRFAPDDYRWEYNKNGNLLGFDKTTSTQWFTWQPHGSQFTIHRSVPGSARRFCINQNVPLVDAETILEKISYNLGWITVYEPD